MDTRNPDNEIKKALMDGTWIDPREKEDVWLNIENRLNTNNNPRGRSIVKGKKRIIRLAASAAAVIILVIGLQTQPGHALVNRIREMFAPEKNITQDIEGNKEEQNVQLNQGKNADYVIYIDQERYMYVEGSEAGKIMPNPPLEERYPEVSMEIKQVVDKKPEALIEDMEAVLKGEFEDVTVPKEVEVPVSGWMVRGLEGNQWNSRLVKIYVISNREQGSFVITQRYFLEAEEGHGARFDNMLKEFHIVRELDE